MEDFSDFATTDFEISDPAADFLAREKALLGEEAELFGNNQALEINDLNITSPTEVPLPLSRSNTNTGNEDYFNKESQSFSQNNDITSNTFSPTPSYTGTQSVNFGQVTGVTSPDRYSTVSQAPSSNYQNIEIESDFIRNWRIQFQDRLGDRDRREAERHTTMKEEAQKALDKFYSEYKQKKEEKINQRGRVYKNELDVNQGKGGWDLVTTIISDNGIKGGQVKDVSRLKDLIYDLKNSGHTPILKT